MESFGRYLRSEREQRGISIEDISRATKISPSQLKALESDEMDALPTTAYVKGFIRAYSKHLGLDPNDALIRFENYLQQIEDEGALPQEFVSRQPLFRRDTPHLGMAVAAGGIILLMIVVLMVVARACSHKESFLQRPAPAQSIAPAFSAIPAIKQARPDAQTAPASVGREQGGEVIMIQPIVPPETFQVRETGPPLPPSALGKSKTPPDAANPGGGNYSTR